MGKRSERRRSATAVTVVVAVHECVTAPSARSAGRRSCRSRQARVFPQKQHRVFEPWRMRSGKFAAILRTVRLRPTWETSPSSDIHHIVEQCQCSTSRSGFSVTPVNSTDNLSRLPPTTSRSTLVRHPTLLTCSTSLGPHHCRRAPGHSAGHGRSTRTGRQAHPRDRGRHTGPTRRRPEDSVERPISLPALAPVCADLTAESAERLCQSASLGGS